MPQDHPGRRASGKPRRRNIIGVLHCKRLAPGNPGIFRPADHRQGDHCISDAPVQNGRNRHCKHQSRKRQTDIRDSHDHCIQNSSEIPAHDADYRSSHGNDRHKDQRRGNTGPRTDDHPGQHIPSIPVRPKQVRRRRRLQRIGQILGIGIIGTDPFRKYTYRKQRQNQRPKDSQPEFRSILFSFPPARSSLLISLHRASPPSRILGSSIR